MTRHKPEQDPIGRVRLFTTREVIEAAELDNPDQPIKKWLGRLCLLYGVPFNCLVPDERMLPAESVRFFFLDQNWLDSLIDGAISIGEGSTRDAAYNKAASATVRKQSRQAMHTVRAELRGEIPPAEPARSTPMTGLLLRSAVVSSWPGLQVKAFDEPSGAGSAMSEKWEEDHRLKPLRIERLAPDVLIAIFAGIARRVEISEPFETLHFGIHEGNKIKLRYIDQVAGKPRGASTGKEESAQFRTARLGYDLRVLSVKNTLPKLNAAVGKPLSPAEFAIQMVRSAEKQVFQNDDPVPRPEVVRAPEAAFVSKDLRVKDLMFE